MLRKILVSLGICFIPVITLCFLYMGFNCSGVALCIANTPVPFLLATLLWLRSEHLARVYLCSVGHHCSYKEKLPTTPAGPSRVSPVWSATLSLVMFLFAFWHLVAVVLLIPWKAGV
ncbi:hypothetical protein LSM04_003556 [Trypanosoma melophagium]|uniref:uncharacterized protein n=1 Tax=Trypanosoma melophagium TaxID=715481 RepID=UPI003519EEEB|nr:hypothetical protein LSM04_003556 [Trypanosoma melophagium]